MSSKHYFAVVLGALALVGCKGGNATGAGGSGTTGSTVSASNTTGSSKVTSSSSSTTGAGGGGNHSFATATMIQVNAPMAATGTLADATKAADYYSFTGKANERLIIEVQAVGLGTKAYDPTVVDPAFALYDTNQMPLTYQNQGWPANSQNATLFVQIPADGTYYIKIQDCNAFFSGGCPNPATGVTNLDYAVAVSDTSMLIAPEVLAANQDGTTAKAMTVAYKATTTAGIYYDAEIGGDFQSATDTHVFKFTPPADTMLSMGARARAEFYVNAIGGEATKTQGGDLSDANIKIWATDAAGQVILSAADQNHFLVDATHFGPLEFSVPVTLGQTYYLFVKNTKTGGSPKSDFYFITHQMNPLIDVGESKETAAQKGNNDTPATAEDPGPQGTAKDFYTLDGNLPAGDVDYMKATVPSGVSKYQVFCDAARSGSGLVGFKAALFGMDGTTAIDSAIEGPDTDLVTMAKPIPATSPAGSVMYLAMSATGQDATDTGTQYRCYLFFAK